jgi:hypothetical protein
MLYSSCSRSLKEKCCGSCGFRFHNTAQYRTGKECAYPGLHDHPADTPAEPAAEAGRVVHHPRLREYVHPGALLQPLWEQFVR